MDQDFVADVSTSEEVKVPVASAVPATPTPASVTAPALAASAFVTTGTSFVPLMVRTTSRVTVALELSVAVMV